MVTTLYILRHCQSVGNTQHRFQGRYDSEISPEGEKQLELLSLRFRNVPLDRIYSSPLQRALLTARAIGRFHDLPVEVREGLIEIDVGDMENLELSEIGTKFPEVAKNWDQFPDLCVFPHGETMEEVYVRANREIDAIIAENPGKTVAVATHGGVLRNVYARVAFGDLQGLRQSAVFGNTGVSILEADEEGGLTWKTVNDLSHLPQELRRQPTKYSFHTEAV